MSSVLAQILAFFASLGDAWKEARAKRIAQDIAAEKKIVDDGDAIVGAIRGQVTGRVGVTAPVIVPDVGVVAVKTSGNGSVN